MVVRVYIILGAPLPYTHATVNSRRYRTPETAGSGQLREKKRRREFTIRYPQPRNWLPPVFHANGLIDLGLIVTSPADSLDIAPRHRNRVLEFTPVSSIFAKIFAKKINDEKFIFQSVIICSKKIKLKKLQKATAIVLVRINIEIFLILCIEEKYCHTY